MSQPVFIISQQVDNLVILIGTPLTITLLASRDDKYRRWGGFSGIIAQVFNTAMNASWSRWGAFIVSVYCGLLYVRSAYMYWIKHRVDLH